ncbi:TPA: hypothetical protein ACH3X1_002742 [Trebouxia sp. C0004]
MRYECARGAYYAKGRWHGPAGLIMSVLADVAGLIEANTLGLRDQASELRRLFLTWHGEKNYQTFRTVCKAVSQVLTDELSAKF